MTAFAVGGMTCGGCARRVSEALAALPGVLKVAVALSAGRVEVETAAGFDPAAVVARLGAMGFSAQQSAP
ncbi:MAG: heavy-metal-associated domain-containing protein [Myxococcales bacterium]|nr:heavy-metal-associated domain-containing protein [Myxococcales bacterium]